MNASEIMTKEVVTVRADANVGEIASLLLDHKISAVPVIDDDRHVVGIVSEGVQRFRLFGQLPGRNKLKGPGSRLLVSPFPEIKFIACCCGVL